MSSRQWKRMMILEMERGAVSKNTSIEGTTSIMDAADLLLITDGEISDPHVPREVMESNSSFDYIQGSGNIGIMHWYSRKYTTCYSVYTDTSFLIPLGESATPK
mmetsp:Transcript_48381/g.54134  ORF Transcript_48381/g.54134 Transcript_48381/m.54134 type:complete len:104 (-) Transcript_48381:27-338(-)